MSLQVDYNRANEIATAACYMGNKTLRIVNQLTMAVTTLMAKQYYPTEKVLTSRIDGQDVCQTLVSEIEEIASWVDFLEDSRKAELRQDPQEIEVEDPSYQLDSSSEDDSDGDDDESQEEQKVQEKKKPGKIHVKYEKDIAITKDGLLGDYQFAATSYLCARELGIQSHANLKSGPEVHDTSGEDAILHGPQSRQRTQRCRGHQQKRANRGAEAQS